MKTKYENFLQHLIHGIDEPKKTFGKFTKWNVLKGLIFREIDDLIISSTGIISFLSFFVGGVVAIQTAINIEAIAEPYIKRRAVRHLEKNRVVIFSAGTGNPFFTTDSAAVLRAIEINADVILKGTRVDGIYTEDPELNDKAIKLDSLSFEEALRLNLKIMDTTAFTLSKENNLPIIVFDMNIKGNLKRVVQGEKIGTKVFL